MSNSQHNEQDELQKYLEEKDKQEQEKAQEPLSEYEACVLRESARVKELIAEAKKKTNEHLEDK